MSLKFFCLLSLLAVPTRAAEPWTLPLFTSDPHAVLAAASRYAEPEGLDALTIDYSVQVQIDKLGKLTQTTRSVTRVLRLQGIAGARRVSIGWVEWRENRPKIKARVISADGQAHLLDESSIEETSTAPDAAGSAGLKLISAVLPDVDVYSVVEVEIEKSGRETAFPGARSGQIAIDAPFLVAHCGVSISATSHLQAEALGFPNQPLVLLQDMGGAHNVIVEASNLFAGPNANALPPGVPSRPTVSFTDVPSWQTVAQWYAGLISKVQASPASAHTAAGGNQLAAIETVFEDLRKKIHDDGLAFGASPYTPHAPAETLEKRSGDSQDEAVLLIAKLADIGIAAKPALISARPRPEIVPSLPGVEAFSRVLVYVGGDHPLWIDPSAEFTPVSRLPDADQGRWALIVDASTTALVRTPESDAAANRAISSTEINLQDGAAASVVETLEGQGSFDDLLRPLANTLNSGDASEKENAQAQLERLVQLQNITKIDAGDPRKLLSPCRVQLTAEGYPASQLTDEGGFIDLPGYISSNLRRLAASLGVTDEENAAAASSPRKFDYYVPPAFKEGRSYRVTLPAGYGFTQAPSIASFTVGPLEFSATAKLDSAGALSITYTLVNPKSRYTPQEVDAMRRDIPKLAEKQTLRVPFVNVAEEKLANGDFKEAIALLRQHAASASASVNPRVRLAVAYLDAGARSAAVKICNDILRKDPNNAAVYARLGWIYTHDEFGRPFSPGMNMPEAEKAYLEAIDLEPNPAYAIDLAMLYTYNSAGIRFGNSARLENALALYRQAGLDVLARAGVINDYATTLLFARKYGELHQFFYYPQADRADPAIKLAGIAAASSADEVKSEANYAFPDPAKRKIVLIEAARYLLNSREFQPAAMLFDIAGGAGQGISAADLALIRKARNFDASAASPQPAIAALQRFIAAVLNPPDPNAWKPFVVAESRDVAVTSFRLQLLQLFGTQETARPPASWPFLSDLLTTAVDLSAEGNAGTGFRIQIADRAGKAAPKTIGYVVKRGNEYLVLGLAGSASESGEALAKIESGDLAGARQWLNWARDEMPAGKAADPMAEAAFERLWPPKSDAVEIVKTAAASIAVRATNDDRGIKALNELRQQIADPELEAALDQALAQALVEHQKFTDAVPVLQRLATKWPDSKIIADDLAQAFIATGHYPEATTTIASIERSEPGTLTAPRLRERLLVQQQKFGEAAVLEGQICANAKASGFDWNDLAWVDLFAHADDKLMLQAANKAGELMEGRNPDVLHTLAVVQATTGQIKEARANAYRLAESSGDSGELLTIFGRIAEQLDLRDVAADYYRRVKKPEGNPALSTYAFAQMRLAQGLDTSSAGQSAANPPK